MNDLISRQAAIDVVDSETVSTNPEHFKSSEKFIKFMDDADIASFGKWQWANGFNTALTATSIQLKKLPSAQLEPQWMSFSKAVPKKDERILITTKHGVVVIGRYYGIDKRKRIEMSLGLSRQSHFKVEDFLDLFRAWMPLPEPYKDFSEYMNEPEEEE